MATRLWQAFQRIICAVCSPCSTLQQRIIVGLPRSAHISATLANIHRLCAAELIKFKLSSFELLMCRHLVDVFARLKR